MTDSAIEREVERLAEEFLARRRRGERPTISEYVRAHPDLAGQINDLFPAIDFLEQAGQRPQPTVALTELGEYRLLRELGRGGMGVVYEAVQASLGRHVALKVLPPAAILNPTFLERFHREARAAAQLHHTNIVPVFGVGEHDGVHYYAMQFINGRGLDSVLSELRQERGQALTRPGPGLTAVAELGGEMAHGLATGPFSATPPSAPSSATTHTPSSDPAGSHSNTYHRGVARIGLQVADALAYAHAQGIQHRDIKPSNLMLDTRGTVWVTDFGLAKSASDGDLTHTGDFVGTLRYMAPERYRGESEPRGDIYSLGATLYELLTLRPAFAESDRAQLVHQVLHDDPPRPRQLDARIPRDLETIVLKAMAKEPRDRYASAEHLAGDLQCYLDDRPIRARRTSVPERAWRWCRRNPKLAGLTGLALALLAVIAIGSPLMTWRIWDQKRQTDEELWRSLVAQAEAHRLTDHAGRRFAALASLDAANRLLPALRPDPARRLRLRNEYLAALSYADLGVAQQWPGYPAGSAGVCFDPGLGRYARSDEHGNITVRRVSDDAEIAALPGAGHGAWTMRFSGDGRYLAAGYQKRLKADPLQFKVWDCARREAIITAPSAAGCGEADFNADGTRVAYMRGVGALALRDLTPGAAERLIKIGDLPRQLAFSPDGSKLAYTQPRTVEIRDVNSTQLEDTFTHQMDVSGLAWRRDSKMLATAAGWFVYLWEPGAKQPLAVLRGHEQVVSEVAFNRAGDLLASKAHDGTVRLWDVATRRQLVRTNSVFTGCAQLHFSPDDRRLGFASDGVNLRLWEVARGSECRTLDVREPANWRSWMGGFSPDGRLLVAAGIDGARVWDWSAGQLLANIPVPKCWSALFAHDGSCLYTTGSQGLCRWPIVRSGSTATIGPPEIIGPETPLELADLSASGQVLAARVRTGEGAIIQLTSPPQRLPLTKHDDLHYCAVSPDGRRVATGTWHGSGVRIWDAATGAPVQEIATDIVSCRVTFSGCGRYLATANDREYGIYDVTTWQRMTTIPRHPESTPGQAEFSADGSILAVRHSPTHLRLVDPVTGELFAELQTPGQRTIVWHALSPDGCRLAACCVGGVLHVWDLHALRAALAERDLDWSPPGQSPRPATSPQTARVISVAK